MMQRIVLITLAVVAALVIVSAFAFAIFQPIKVLPRMDVAPAFSLTDQNGERLTNEDLRGNIVLYTFTHTSCQTPCSQPAEIMRGVQEGLPGIELNQIPVQFVAISFDPENDSPEALQRYASSIGADPALWRFATASDAEKLKYLIGSGFEVYYKELPEGGFQYDPVLILVDGAGLIRGEYRYGSAEANTQRILNHIGVLAEEAVKSEGPTRLAYEAAHLFMCYAP